MGNGDSEGDIVQHEIAAAVAECVEGSVIKHGWDDHFLIGIVEGVPFEGFRVREHKLVDGGYSRDQQDDLVSVLVDADSAQDGCVLES